MRSLLALLFVVAGASSAQAQYVRPQTGTIPYYGNIFYSRLGAGESNQNLKGLISTIMRADHLAVPNGFDQIVQSCQGQQGCYRHTAIGYNRARVFLMGQFYLVQNGNQFGVRDVYCERIYGGNDFGSDRRPGPNQIPDDRVINTEHTWPQSRFNGQFQKEEQKSDLHHLFPTDSKMNGIRGNFEFGYVVRDQQILKCPQARFGVSASGRTVFQPPAHHEGNVARALFYFSIRYQLPIGPEEEAALRRWNREDPVDQEEMMRNEAIYKTQGSRNPFIDYPELADRIQDF